jgi:hypothetical protein
MLFGSYLSFNNTFTILEKILRLNCIPDKLTALQLKEGLLGIKIKKKERTVNILFLIYAVMGFFTS